MRARLPGAMEFVYDNYYALVVGFGPTDRPSEAPFSIVIYPRWVTLCFLDGADLPDPGGLLRGSGKMVRSIRLDDETVLGRPAVKALMAEAIRRTEPPFRKGARRRISVRMALAKRRPRR